MADELKNPIDEFRTRLDKLCADKGISRNFLVNGIVANWAREMNLPIPEAGNVEQIKDISIKHLRFLEARHQKRCTSGPIWRRFYYKWNLHVTMSNLRWTLIDKYIFRFQKWWHGT